MAPSAMGRRTDIGQLQVWATLSEGRQSRRRPPPGATRTDWLRVGAAWGSNRPLRHLHRTTSDAASVRARTGPAASSPMHSQPGMSPACRCFRLHLASLPRLHRCTSTATRWRQGMSPCDCVQCRLRGWAATRSFSCGQPFVRVRGDLALQSPVPVPRRTRQ